MISIDDFKKLEIKAGKILSAEVIEGSDKLLKLEVDLGPVLTEGFGEAKEEKRDIRQIISGIKKFIEDPASLVGTTCAFATNLEPREIFGLQSQGMILATSGNTLLDETESFFSLLKIDAPPGSPVK